MQETQVRSLGWEDQRKMTAHSSILAWKIPWTEEPGRLQSMGLQRVRHGWDLNTHTHKDWEGASPREIPGREDASWGKFRSKKLHSKKGSEPSEGIFRNITTASVHLSLFVADASLPSRFSAAGVLSVKFSAENLGLGFLEGCLKGSYGRVPWNIDHKPTEMSEKDQKERSILMVLKYFTGKIELFIDSLTLVFIRKALWLFSKSNLWLLWLCVKMLIYSCLENPMDRGDWQAMVHTVEESGRTKGT